MPADPNPPLTDEALDRLARGWFAEARARSRADEQEGRRPSRTDRAAGDADSGILDWLFGGDASDDGACDAGGGDGD